jgi:hypothetical protein
MSWGLFALICLVWFVWGLWERKDRETKETQNQILTELQNLREESERLKPLDELGFGGDIRHGTDSLGRPYYRVTLREGDKTFVSGCWAENEEHARKHKLSFHPNAQIISVERE